MSEFLKLRINDTAQLSFILNSLCSHRIFYRNNNDIFYSRKNHISKLFAIPFSSYEFSPLRLKLNFSRSIFSRFATPDSRINERGKQRDHRRFRFGEKRRKRQRNSRRLRTPMSSQRNGNQTDDQNTLDEFQCGWGGRTIVHPHEREP